MQDNYYHPLFAIPLAIAAIGWLTTYVVIIRRSLADQACGMPLIPLCINCAWEFVFGFVLPDKPPANYANMLWFVFDIGIVYTYLKYGRREFPKLLPAWSFVPSFVMLMALALIGVLAVTYQFKDWTGSISGWGDNLLVFSMWIAMLLRRGNTRGQSMYAVLPAFVGSACLIPLEMIISPSSLLLTFFYAGFLIVGPVYSWLLWRTFKAEGLNPWKVF